MSAIIILTRRILLSQPLSPLGHRHYLSRLIHRTVPLCSAAEPATVLSPNETSPKIRSLVDEIAKLTLLEVAELNQSLKETLKIPDAPMMAAFSAMPAQSAAKAEEEDSEASSKAVQTAFTVKITKFDEGKKVALIKEVKSVVEGLNLVQAKKFVESVPQVVKNNLSKEEAEKLKATLESVGATCVLE